MSDKKFNKTLSPLWKTKTGGYYSFIKDENFDALQEVEKGGMIVIKVIDESKRKGETSPHAYLEYVSVDELAAGNDSTSRVAPKRKAAPSRAAEDDI